MLIVHDIDLRKWTFEAKKELKFEGDRFKASNDWLHNFKKSYQIVSRTIKIFLT